MSFCLAWALAGSAPRDGHPPLPREKSQSWPQTGVQRTLGEDATCVLGVTEELCSFLSAVPCCLFPWLPVPFFFCVDAKRPGS